MARWLSYFKQYFWYRLFLFAMRGFMNSSDRKSYEKRESVNKYEWSVFRLQFSLAVTDEE